MLTISRDRRNDRGSAGNRAQERSTRPITARSLPTVRRFVAEEVFRTRAEFGPLVLRLVIAVVLFPHGAQHLLGWFGGYGFGGTYAWMVSLGFPGPMAVLAIVTEFVAPIALGLGIAARPAAAGVIGLMLGATSVHVANGFFMNWFGILPAGAEGYEYHILMIAMAVAILISGGGRWSMDRVVTRRLSERC